MLVVNLFKMIDLAVSNTACKTTRKVNCSVLNTEPELSGSCSFPWAEVPEKKKKKCTFHTLRWPVAY